MMMIVDYDLERHFRWMFGVVVPPVQMSGKHLCHLHRKSQSTIHDNESPSLLKRLQDTETMPSPPIATPP